MSTAIAMAADQVAWKPKVNPWIIGVTVSLAAFMEVLDSSIANVALPHIAGNLGASNDESTWVLTSYLVSNAIVLPISGFLVSFFGRQRFFMLCIAFFTMSSFLCGIAPTLGFLLLFRILQGAFGGGLQPMAQAILADTFPPEQQGLAFSLYGITVIVGPILGPTLGGWITDNYSWRWIFYINIPVGILALFLIQKLLEDPPYLARIKKGFAKFDYVGFSLLALGVSALQIVLDKGQEDDWFGSRFIMSLVVISVVSLISLIIWEWNHKEPIVDLRLFWNLNYAASDLMFLIFGAALFSATVLMPQLLQTLMGYTAEQAGLVLSAGGVAVLLIMPLVAQLTTRVQARYIIAFGWLGMAASMYVSAKQTDLLMSFANSAWLRIFQCIPLPFLFVPITAAAYVGLPNDKKNAAAGMMNFMRNMGQSIGTSAVTTIIARRTQYHQSVLANYTGSGRFQNAIAGLGGQLSHAGISLKTAQHQALGRLYGLLQMQAAALSYIDIYWLLAVACSVIFFGSFFLQKNEPGTGGTVPMH
jgi:DHA2 family multidrug resistance protein